MRKSRIEITIMIRIIDARRRPASISIPHPVHSCSYCEDDRIIQMSEASISDAQQLKNETAPRKREAVSTSELREASDRFLELLGGSECNLLRRLDLDRFASGGVAAHTRRTPTDLQDAEAGHTHLVALLQVLDNGVDESAQEFRSGFLRHLML